MMDEQNRVSHSIWFFDEHGKFLLSVSGGDLSTCFAHFSDPTAEGAVKQAALENWENVTSCCPESWPSIEGHKRKAELKADKFYILRHPGQTHLL